MKSIRTLRPRLFPLALTIGLVCVSGHADEEATPIQRERLWLPPSSAHLMPMLEYAAELALSNPDCKQILYGRLNEFRSERGAEPAMTILCQQDPRTTFNMIFQASDLEEALIGDSSDVQFSDEDPSSNLEALRDLLLSNSELRQRSGEVPSNDDTAAEQESGDELDLELELEDLMQNRPRPSDNPPELF